MFKQMKQIHSYPRWLLYSDKATIIHNVMHHVYVPFDCEFILATENKSGISLTEVYMVAPSAQMNEVHFGTWSKNRGLQVTKLSLYARRNNLEGATLRAAIAQSKPFTIYQGEGIPKGEVDGFLGNIWKILQNISNFTTEYVTPDDRAWGSRYPNGSWNGMVGMVIGKQAQISASEFTFMETRVKEVDFLLPFVSSSLSIVVRQPDSVSLKWTDLVSPLATGMWAATVAFILCAAATLLLVLRVWFNHGKKPTQHGGTDYCLSDALLQVFGVFCNQGSANMLLSVSSRAVFIMACVTSLVVVAAYSASLISFLTVQKKELPFNNLREFAADGSYRLGMMDKSSALAFFQTATDPLLNEVYRRFVYPDLGRLSLDDSEGMKRLCKENRFAFVSSRLYADHIIKTLPCAVTWVPEGIMTDTMSFIIEKRSPYRGIFDYNLRQLRDTGILGKLRQDAWPKDLGLEHQSFTVISFDDVVPVLAVLGTGVVIAVATLIVELNLLRLCRLLKVVTTRLAGTQLRMITSSSTYTILIHLMDYMQMC